MFFINNTVYRRTILKKLKLRRPAFNLLDSSDSPIPGGNICFLIAFVIPLVIFGALYYVRNFFPFGELCYLRSDMYHQYAPFFSELWHKLSNGESLFYSWDIGMGTNFLSLFAYYLASPSNWLVLLFPQKYMIEVMNVFIILKLAGSSTTLTYYISKHFHTKKCIIVLFGIFYALSAYTAAYSWNIMWLDCILLLPLIMLGLERLVKENKGFLYCISLGLCILSNYYISIMVCISVILYFIVLLISYDGVRRPIVYLKKFLHWVLYSLLAGGIAAILLLPELYTFSLSASSSFSFPKSLSIYFSLMEMLVRQLINVPVHMGLEHYPNIYCGVAVLLLIPLYVMNKQINTREKIGKCTILLIFLLSYNMNILNFIWHGFHYPNSLPCRQAFIYIFFLLAMGYEAFHHLTFSSCRQIVGALWIALGFLVLAEEVFKGSELYNTKIFYISGAFILIYALLLYMHKRVNWQVPLLLAAFAASIVEVTINMESTGLGATNRTSYLLDYNAVKTVSQTVAAEDDSLYRMDKIWGARSKNDGAWHNYHTISTFSSTSSRGVSDLFGSLGMEHSTNSYGYNGSTMVTNALFSVKYLISNKTLAESPLLAYETGNDGEFIYRNTCVLPIGFRVPANLGFIWKLTVSSDGIVNQNSLMSSLTGINPFELAYSYHAESNVTFSPDKSGHMYLALQDTTVDCDSVGVSINGIVTNYTGLEGGNHLLDIGYITPADAVNVYADSPMNLNAYLLDTDKFQSAIKMLQEQSFNVDSWSDTRITGTASIQKDGCFLFSIPYDKGWTVKVDGKKVHAYSLNDALLMIDITAGDHSITLSYMPVNFIQGCIITCGSILLLIFIAIFIRLMRNGRISIDSLPDGLIEIISEQDGAAVNAADEDEDEDEADELEFLPLESVHPEPDEHPDEQPDALLDAMDDFEHLDLDDLEH